MAAASPQQPIPDTPAVAAVTAAAKPYNFRVRKDLGTHVSSPRQRRNSPGGAATPENISGKTKERDSSPKRKPPKKKKSAPPPANDTQNTGNDSDWMDVLDENSASSSGGNEQQGRQKEATQDPIPSPVTSSSAPSSSAGQTTPEGHSLHDANQNRGATSTPEKSASTRRATSKSGGKDKGKATPDDHFQIEEDDHSLSEGDSANESSDNSEGTSHNSPSEKRHVSFSDQDESSEDELDTQYAQQAVSMLHETNTSDSASQPAFPSKGVKRRQDSRPMHRNRGEQRNFQPRPFNNRDDSDKSKQRNNRNFRKRGGSTNNFTKPCEASGRQDSGDRGYIAKLSSMEHSRALGANPNPIWRIHSTKCISQHTETEYSTPRSDGESWTNECYGRSGSRVNRFESGVGASTLSAEECIYLGNFSSPQGVRRPQVGLRLQAGQHEISTSAAFQAGSGVRRTEISSPGRQSPAGRLDIRLSSGEPAPKLRKMFAFVFKGRVNCYNVIPFGWSWAPWIFHRVMQVPTRILRRKGLRVLNYLDDFLLIARDQQETDVFITTLKDLGLVINPTKSISGLASQVTWLGFTFDLSLLTVALTQAKIIKVEKEVGKCLRRADATKKVSQLQLAKSLGLINSYRLAVPMTIPYTRNLHALLPRSANIWRRNQYVRISHQDRDDLRVALMRVIQAQPRPLLHYGEEVDLRLTSQAPTMFTDASDFGIGGILQSSKLSVVFSERLPTTMRDAPIHVKEIFAVQRMIIRYADQIKGSVVRAYTDNSTCLSYLHKKGGRIPSLTLMTRKNFDCAGAHGIRLVPLRVSSVDNPADAPSRSPTLWYPGTAEVERCISVLNRVRPSLAPWHAIHPQQAPVELAHYHRAKLWAPNPDLINKVAHYIMDYGGAVLTPYWPSAKWRPVLAAAGLEPIVLRDRWSPQKFQCWVH